MIRYIRLFITTLICFVSFAGCAVDDTDTTVILNLSDHEVAVPCTGGIYDLSVESNVDWSVEAIGEGIASDVYSGRGDATLRISVEPNEEAALTGVIKITTKGTSQVTALCQYLRKAYPTIVLTPASAAIPNSGGTKIFALTSNTAWKVSSDAKFITVEPLSGSGDADITITVEPNDKTEDRTTAVTFTTDDAVAVSSDVAITQTAKSFVEPAEERVEMVREGGVVNVAVSANVEWKISNIDGSFVSAEAQEDNLRITIEPNTDAMREAVITLVTVEETPATATVTVHQAPDPKLSLSVARIDVPLVGGDFIVQVECNTSWESFATGNMDNMTIAPDKGDGNEEVTLTIGDADGVNRNAEITFKTTGANAVEVVLEVSQSSTPMISVSPVTITNQNAAEAEHVVNITSNTDWSLLSKTDGILSVTPSSGNGNTVVTVRTAQNDLLTEAVDNVVFQTATDDKQAVLTVKRPPIMAISPSELQFPYDGATLTVSITTILDWTITCSSADINVSPSSGHGSATVEVTLEANTTTSLREGEIVVAFGSHTQKIACSQPRASFIYGGETYNIVKLRDGRWWMADNLRYLPSGVTPSDDPKVESGVWYPYTDYIAPVYEKDENGKDITNPDGSKNLLEPASWRVLTDAESVRCYGYFYDANTIFGRMVTSSNYKNLEELQGICPAGWHIASEAEVQALIDAYKRADKSTYMEDLEADGFLFLPSGMRQRNGLTATGTFSSQISEFFTTSTGFSYTEISGQIMMKNMTFNGNNSKAIVSNQSVLNAGHVRCIKNK